MGGGREEGLGGEGGAAGVPSAQALRGAAGEGPGSVRRTPQLPPPLHCVCCCRGGFSWGGLGNLVWAPVAD